MPPAPDEVPTAPAKAPAKAKPERPPAPAWRAAGEPEEEELEDLEGAPHRKRKARRLVRDPVTGKMVAMIRRKRSRRRGEWMRDVETWEEETDTEGEEPDMRDFDLFGEPEEFGFEDEEDDEE